MSIPQVIQDILASAGDLLLVVLGFSAIIVIHEAGHFFAARWAGIRVLAFAVGFGPALFSFRKGLGFRRGSSEPEYKQLTTDAQGERGEKREASHAALSGKISPTEYRLNILPFGGYVKMLGQDDADPGAVSDDPDSYSNCIPWKRMVVISAGVVFNVITAAILFIIVFNPHVGLLCEPAMVGGVIDPERPAAVAVASNAAELGVTTPGLKPGDVILSVNGERPSHFNDFSLFVAMSKRSDESPDKGRPLAIDVQRPGVNGVLHFSITPRVDESSGMLSIGALRYASDHLPFGSRRENADLQRVLDLNGFGELRPGSRLVGVDGKPARSAYDLDEAVERSGGRSVTASFQERSAPGTGAPKTVTIPVSPRPELLITRVKIQVDGKPVSVYPRHLLGLMPILSVDSVEKGSPAMKAGIKPGDVFARLGNTEWPSVPVGLAVIKSSRDADLAVVVSRQTSPGTWEEVDLGIVRTSSSGQLGFGRTDSAYTSNIVAGWPLSGVDGPTPSGGALPGLKSGSRILAANGRPVATLGELRNVLKEIAAAEPHAVVTLTVQPPSGSPNAAPRSSEEIRWPLGPEDAPTLARLGWESPLDSRLFDYKRFVWKSDTVLGAIPMGLQETHRVMMNTYLTFARLFQGTVKVEHLKGPVGIAHVGVAIADKGPVWLLFFMALISVNLAVINFLPMPIADGGHMVFLIYEQITGRPPSVRFQNAAAITGLVIIGTLFLIVTFHDVSSVFTDLRRFFGGG
jgi:regulator of sigma E protease